MNTAPATTAASGATSTVVSSDRTIDHGAVSTPTSTSLTLGPRAERRTVSALLDRSAARSRVITASEMTVPATGSSTARATAATIGARPMTGGDGAGVALSAVRGAAGRAAVSWPGGAG